MSLTPNPIPGVNYLQGAPGGASIPVTVGASERNEASRCLVAGIPGTSVVPASGQANAVVALNIDAASLSAGTYVGTSSERACVGEPDRRRADCLETSCRPARTRRRRPLAPCPRTSWSRPHRRRRDVNFFTPIATDNFYPAPTVNVNPPSGSTFPVGTTLVTVTATDASGIVSQKTFTVTARDTTRPTASIATPQSGVVYSIGQFVLPSFSCTDIVLVARAAWDRLLKGVAIDTSAPKHVHVHTDRDGRRRQRVNRVDDLQRRRRRYPQASVDFEGDPLASTVDGSEPCGRAHQGERRQLLRTSNTGGKHGWRDTVFKMDSSGTVTTLHSFDYTSLTARIRSRVSCGHRRQLLRRTTWAGPGTSGTVFKIDPAGTLRRLCTRSRPTTGLNRSARSSRVLTAASTARRTGAGRAGTARSSKWMAQALLRSFTPSATARARIR